ncbi:MAG TPA: efflux RND transporter periplasmic adaptor subunit, partial [Isosphaeraceae bacterium]|nr:efflux RND transporter periplasmic adaptor subunit [Isosphaeraceae bacterium]
MSPPTAARSSETAQRRDGGSDRRWPRDDDQPRRWPQEEEADGSDPSGGGWAKIALAVLGAVILAAAVYWWMHRDEHSKAGGGQEASGQEGAKNQAALRVKVVHPHKGGMTRTTTQPGTLHAFQYADLYAKASGYLRAQVVDIGDTVEKGQVLAEVYDPERQQQVELTAAEVERARAAVRQAESRKTAAEAQVQAAEAEIAVRKTEVSQTAAIRRFREKEFIRYAEIARKNAVDQRVADERQEEYEGAKAAEDRAHAAVKAAEADLAKALAQVIRAEADIQRQRAEQRVAEARLAMAQILARYTRILSPYTGVVTQRNFHDGDFIREAIRGEELPILQVARTDLMRVIVYVPDRDTPLLDRGDPAVVRIDALGGEEFRGKVTRFSEYELPTNRTMRTEVDLPNPTGRLRMGMYGPVSILLEPPTDFLTIPSKALHEVESSAGSVYVADGDRARKRPIHIGRDDGIRVEVLSGLTTDDPVIVSYTGS